MLAWLGGSNHRMPGCTGMFGGVAIWRAITAQRYSALLTSSKMNPTRPDFHAFAAFANFRLLDRGDRVEMGATSRAHLRLLFSDEVSRR